MKKILFAAMLFLTAFVLNIACSKSNDLKNTNTKVNDATTVVADCPCNNDTSGVYMPQILGSHNVNPVFFLGYCHFHRIGHEVTVDGNANIQNGVNAAALQTNATISFTTPTPPVIFNGGSQFNSYGTGMIIGPSYTPGLAFIQGVNGSSIFVLYLRPTFSGAFNVYFHFAYTEATTPQ